MAAKKVLEDRQHIQTFLLRVAFYICLSSWCFPVLVSSAETVGTKSPLLAADESLRNAVCNTPNSTVLHSLTGDCLSELFTKYGSKRRLNFDGFTRLLDSVGLGATHSVSQQLNASEHAHTHEQAVVTGEANETGISKRDIAVSNNLTAGNNSNPHYNHVDHHTNRQHTTTCLPPDEILHTLAVIPSEGITPFQFLQICPILLQQLDNHVCVVYDIHPPEGGENHSIESPVPTPAVEEAIPLGHIWGYAIGAVTMISVASVTCIMMVPCIQRFPQAYGRLLSFLVAMAVGTLSGDAVLHLLPHAFGIHGHSEETASASGEHATHATPPATASSKHIVVWRGCIVLLGIFSFFVFEQFMRMCQHRPRKKLITLVQDPPSNQEISCHSNDDISCHSNDISCHSNHREDSKMSSSSGSLHKDAMGSQDIGERLCNHNEKAHELSPMMDHSPNEAKVVNERFSGVFSFKGKSSSSNPYIPASLDEEKQEMTEQKNGRTASTSDKETSFQDMTTSIGRLDTEALQVSTSPTSHKKKASKSRRHSHDSHDHEHDNNYQEQQHQHSEHHHHDDHQHHHHHHHHGHSHVHSHSHAGKSGISAIAWMVVMGDGVHNFTDGLVVGAAFVDSMAGGLSTAIAVMCHEIPHELGDFAVMLRGGMSIKQALGFQAVSSILAYIGMALGILIGNFSSVSLWIFALAAGAFLYIALTDLFPEMVESMNNTTDSKSCHLLLQVLGALFGIGTMLVIALYEELLIEALG